MTKKSYARANSSDWANGEGAKQVLQDRADNSQFAKLKIALIGLFCYIAERTDARISRGS